MIGWGVDKLIQEPKNIDRFRKVLLKSNEEYGRDLEYELLPLGQRPHTLVEKYVVLAAVHDSCCWQVQPIHPWSDLNERSTIGTKYFGLMGLVPRVLTPADEPALESFLDAVKGDLAKQPAETGRDIAHAEKERTKWQRIRRLLRKAQRWIYGVIIFLAALLGVLYYLDLLERIKAFFGTILR